MPGKYMAQDQEAHCYETWKRCVSHHWEDFT